jgi:hypothetical protein
MLDEIQRLQLAQIVASVGQTEPVSQPAPEPHKRGAARVAGYMKDAATVEAYRQKLGAQGGAAGKLVSERDISNAETVVNCLSSRNANGSSGATAGLELGSPRTVRVLHQSYKNLHEVQRSLQRAYIDDPDPSPESARRLDRFMRAVSKFEELLAAAEAPAGKTQRSATARSGQERFRTLITRLESKPRLSELTRAVTEYDRDYRALEHAPSGERFKLAQEVSKNLTLISHLVSKAWRDQPEPDERSALEELHAIFSMQLKSPQFEALTAPPASGAKNG